MMKAILDTNSDFHPFFHHIFQITLKICARGEIVGLTAEVVPASIVLSMLETQPHISVDRHGKIIFLFFPKKNSYNNPGPLV